MFKILVIGIGENVLSRRQKELICGCGTVFGTQRFGTLAEEAGVAAEKFLPITPLADSLGAMAKLLEHETVAVLCSGDPLFYGIGKKLLDRFPPQQVEFYPALSSVQLACSRFKIPWDDARFVSLHGRSPGHLPTVLLRHPKTIIFTDRANSPDKIAARLLEYFQTIEDTDYGARITAMVVADIGLATENIFTGSLQQCVDTTFSPLNIFCLLLPQQPQTDVPVCSLGLGEETIAHSRGLITKNEVRAATLHTLQLPTRGVMWDIGAGSGSVSIEAARANPDLTVYAVEHNRTEIENIKSNIRKFRCFNVVPVSGRAPDALTSLPSPDRIFVGGSGGSLQQLIEIAKDILPQTGRIVVNGVIAKTVESAPRLMRANNFRVSTATVAVSRTDSEGNTQQFNPITIITGTR
ncbi:precorrin-6y C5,15-methyltransferase (decarboxylating) subunit CbiE [Desulforhopalus singaporensis]|uniref:tRNA (guanine(46)-N(7))-methyltransferase n=1 Tax=Desulforhopalus singaporensis TaxID=91360 RepID=A0A1H0NWI3_9BACT|nr:precorrin-6y C5,15-methyltransferase (decarboxylating) subunit CbiE [Desulforhopalus singaporensis]SDO97152.1 precorrin-6Y C5,15-methyltransferase (decarboxylating) [Desulforhopalus singaporensis]